MGLLDGGTPGQYGGVMPMTLMTALLKSEHTIATRRAKRTYTYHHSSVKPCYEIAFVTHTRRVFIYNGRTGAMRWATKIDMTEENWIPFQPMRLKKFRVRMPKE